MGKYDMPGVADLKKDEKGVWSFTTTAPLAPELYSYTMMVDGASVTDHLNVYTVRDIANVSNYFLIGGGKADLYKVNKVAHGPYQRSGMMMPKLVLLAV